MAEDDIIVEGYFDGLADDRDDLPPGSNYPAAYVHGWKNGRDDRRGRPGQSAGILRKSLIKIFDTDDRAVVVPKRRGDPSDIHSAEAISGAVSHPKLMDTVLVYRADQRLNMFVAVRVPQRRL